MPYRNADKRKPSHGHGYHAQKSVEDRMCDSNKQIDSLIVVIN